MDNIQTKLVKSVPVFYQPDDEKIKSIISLFDNKTTIVDVGCGSGYFMYSLMKNGHSNFIGFEIFSDSVTNAQSGLPLEVCSKILPWDVNDESAKKLLADFNKVPDRNIALFLVRPCHHYLLIDSTIELGKELGIPVYYIGLEKNVGIDLISRKFEQIDLAGTSEENEIILKIIQ